MFKEPLKKPNLPENRVWDVAVTDYSEKLTDLLIEYNINIVKTHYSENLDKRVNYHTDMLINNICTGVILTDVTQKENIVKYLTIGYKCVFLDNIVKSGYPGDSLLNSVVIGDNLICNKNTVHASVLEYANNNNYKILSVNQGYSKCSVCVVSDKSIITDDESIYNVCSANNIDSLLINKGSIILNGFDYGFIGGCTGLIDKDKMLFNGDINYHSDCNRILSFLEKYKIQPVIIENEPLTDIGSIIPLTEETSL